MRWWLWVMSCSFISPHFPLSSTSLLQRLLLVSFCMFFICELLLDLSVSEVYQAFTSCGASSEVMVVRSSLRLQKETCPPTSWRSFLTCCAVIKGFILSLCCSSTRLLLLDWPARLPFSSFLFLEVTQQLILSNHQTTFDMSLREFSFFWPSLSCSWLACSTLYSSYWQTTPPHSKW